MDRKEYEKWIEYLKNNGLKLNGSYLDKITNYNSWNGRLITSRFVASYCKDESNPEIKKEILNGSLEIMEDTLNNLMKEYKVSDEYNYKDFIEQKIWALVDVSWLQWIIYKDDKKALDYINEALELLGQVDFDLKFVVRGQIYETKWNIFLDLGREDEVLQEVENVISKYKDAEKYKESYLYYSYFIMAEIEKEKGNMEKALEYLKESLSYFPLDARKIEMENAIWETRYDNYEKAYIKMQELTHFNPVWELSNYEEIEEEIKITENRGKHYTKEEIEELDKISSTIKTKEEMYEVAGELAEKFRRTIPGICKQIEIRNNWFWAKKE